VLERVFVYRDHGSPGSISGDHQREIDVDVRLWTASIASASSCHGMKRGWAGGYVQPGKRNRGDIVDCHIGFFRE